MGSGEAGRTATMRRSALRLPPPSGESRFVCIRSRPISGGIVLLLVVCALSCGFISHPGGYAGPPLAPSETATVLNPMMTFAFPRIVVMSVDGGMPWTSPSVIRYSMRTIELVPGPHRLVVMPWDPDNFTAGSHPQTLNFTAEPGHAYELMGRYIGEEKHIPGPDASHPGFSSQRWTTWIIDTATGVVVRP